MKHALVLGSLFALMIGLNGCGSNPDSLMKQQIAVMNDMADAIEKEAPQSEIEALEKRAEAIGEKMEKLDLTEQEKKQLLERHKDELSKAMGRLMSAAMSRSMKGLKTKFPAAPGGN